MELDNSAHILSIGYVHRLRPFDAEYDVGEAVGTGGFAVGAGWRQIRVCAQPRGALKSSLTVSKTAKARRVCGRNTCFGFFLFVVSVPAGWWCARQRTEPRARCTLSSLCGTV